MNGRDPGRRPDGVPPTNYRLLVVAGVLLLIPIVALMWVSSYARVNPRLGPFPFFFWYQFMWVFLCAGFTYAAYRLVLAARKQAPPPTSPRRHDSTPMDGEM